MKLRLIGSFVCLIAFGSIISGCASLNSVTASQCIVLANGGRKLCGEEAAAWCKSTNAIRESAQGSGAINESIKESQKLCKKIENEN
jgi:hypothetical protein